MAAAEPVWHHAGAGPRLAGGGGGRAGRAAADDSSPWVRAARLGPSEAGLARAGLACFEAAEKALQRSGAPAAVREQVSDFAERYVVRGRCPADDMLEESR